MSMDTKKFTDALHRGFEPNDMSNLVNAYQWLGGIAERDCDCRSYSDETTVVDNPCDVCMARNARDHIDKVLAPQLEGLHPNRMQNPAERIYVEVWRQQNERHPWLNSGHTLLEWILCPEGQKKPGRVSQHDATVATTVIQFLGTNGGRCLMHTAEQLIDRQRATRSEFGTDGGHEVRVVYEKRTNEPESPVYQVADDIASQFISADRKQSAHTALRRAIINAITKFNANALTAKG